MGEHWLRILAGCAAPSTWVSSPVRCYSLSASWTSPVVSGIIWMAHGSAVSALKAAMRVDCCYYSVPNNVLGTRGLKKKRKRWSLPSRNFQPCAGKARHTQINQICNTSRLYLLLKWWLKTDICRSSEKAKIISRLDKSGMPLGGGEAWVGWQSRQRRQRRSLHQGVAHQ